MLDVPLSLVWHQERDRVRAHVLMCFLAWVIWRTLGQWQEWTGHGKEPHMIVEGTGRIQSAHESSPTTNGQELTMRCVARSEPSQKCFPDRLGLILPRLLRPPSGVTMQWSDESRTPPPAPWRA